MIKEKFKKLENLTENIIFGSRWLLAPFYLGLVVAIVLLFVKFVQELWHLFSGVVVYTESDVIVGILALIDMSLVGSLLLMVVFSGYEIFVSKIDVAHHNKDRPEWMGKLDFSGLKLKVISAIVAISAIDLLKTFMNIATEITDTEERAIKWKLLVHLVFVVSGVMFAIMEKVAGDTKRH